MHRAGPMNVAAAALAIACALGGCAKKILIQRYPPFHSSEIKTVAVVGFSGKDSAAGAGLALGRRFARALARNGTYETISPDKLDATIAPGGDPEKLAAALRKAGEPDAFITGEVELQTRTVSGVREYPSRYYGGVGFGYGRGWRHGYYGYHDYWWGHDDYYPAVYRYTRHEVTVRVTAELHRTGDGRLLHATATPIAVTLFREGDPPELDPRTLLDQALAVAARRLLAEFAVVETAIQVKPGDTLRTVLPRPDGTWRRTEDLPAGRAKLHVLVSLPDACDRNTFRLTIVRDEGKAEHRHELASRQFVWSADAPGGRRVIEFDQAALEKARGPGKYKIRFYAARRGRPVFTRDFRIRPVVIHAAAPTR